MARDFKNTIGSTNLELGIVTGDTKVVEKGSADGIYINTAGVGYLDKNINISPINITEGDDIIINGSIAEHGLAILSQRKEFNFKTSLTYKISPFLYLGTSLV